MGKEVSMSDKQDKPEKKYFTLNIEVDEQGALKISNDGKGFSDYEVVGFLEVVKTNITKSILDYFKQ